MDLLVLLASRPGGVFLKNELFQSLWPGVFVGEDTLPRAISKLRKALGDTTKKPQYIKTIPKRGYQLITHVTMAEDLDKNIREKRWTALRSIQAFAAILFVFLIVLGTFNPWSASENIDEPLSGAASLTKRADDYYMRFSHEDNEAAISLYERVIAETPSFAPAQAGLANALIQRIVRWPGKPGQSANGKESLHAALEAGLTSSVKAQETLSRAQALAERAVRIAPDNAAAQKALGLVYSAQKDFNRAVAAYEKSLSLDSNAWTPLINLGEIYQIRGNNRTALHYFEKAYHVMARVYDSEPQRIGPWHAALGVVIAQSYEEFDQPQEAEIWYRRVLVFSPFEPIATARLANLIAAHGDMAEARRLCMTLVEKIGAVTGCIDFLAESPP